MNRNTSELSYLPLSGCLEWLLVLIQCRQVTSGVVPTLAPARPSGVDRNPSPVARVTTEDHPPRNVLNGDVVGMRGYNPLQPQPQGMQSEGEDCVIFSRGGLTYLADSLPTHFLLPFLIY